MPRGHASSLPRKLSFLWRVVCAGERSKSCVGAHCCKIDGAARHRWTSSTRTRSPTSRPSNPQTTLISPPATSHSTQSIRSRSLTGRIAANTAGPGFANVMKPESTDGASGLRPPEVSSCERCPPAWPCPLPTPAGRLFQRPPPQRRLGGWPREPALRPCGRPPCRPAAIFPRTTRPDSAPREQPWLSARLQAAHAEPLPGFCLNGSATLSGSEYRRSCQPAGDSMTRRFASLPVV